MYFIGIDVSTKESALCILDGVNVILQHDLLRRMGKAHRGPPAPIGQGPGTSLSVDLTMA